MDPAAEVSDEQAQVFATYLLNTSKEMTMRRPINLALLLRSMASTLGFLLLVTAPNLARVEAAFPGFNGKIVFVRSVLQTPPCTGFCNFLPSQIYVMNPDGSGATALTQDSFANADPAWSPDGSRIVFAGGLINGAAGSGDIFVMEADGTGRVNLTNCPSSDRFPAWSPDGTKIVFTQAPTLFGPTGVYVMNSAPSGAACGGATLLVNDALWPAWSPDGSTIAFVAVGATTLTVGKIYLMNPDGTDVRQLTTDPSFADIQPSWSPDGSRLAFTRTPISGGPLAIDVINRDGSGLTALTTGQGFFSNNSEPAWSPDGKKIAFSRVTRTGASIFVMNSNGNGDTQLTAIMPLSDDEQPNWQPLAARP